MKKKLEAAVLTLQKEKHRNAVVPFSYKSGLNRSVEGKVFYAEDGIPAYELQDWKGYSDKYIRSKVKTSFNALTGNFVKIPNSGDSILTTHFLANDLTMGDVIVLPSNTPYFKVNQGPLDCNGRNLGLEFNARFIGKSNESCSPGTPPIWYVEFKLL